MSQREQIRATAAAFGHRAPVEDLTNRTRQRPELTVLYRVRSQACPSPALCRTAKR